MKLLKHCWVSHPPMYRRSASGEWPNFEGHMSAYFVSGLHEKADFNLTTKLVVDP